MGQLEVSPRTEKSKRVGGVRGKGRSGQKKGGEGLRDGSCTCSLRNLPTNLPNVGHICLILEGIQGRERRKKDAALGKRFSVQGFRLDYSRELCRVILKKDPGNSEKRKEKGGKGKAGN